MNTISRRTLKSYVDFSTTADRRGLSTRYTNAEAKKERKTSRPLDLPLPLHVFRLSWCLHLSLSVKLYFSARHYLLCLSSQTFSSFPSTPTILTHVQSFWVAYFTLMVLTFGSTAFSHLSHILQRRPAIQVNGRTIAMTILNLVVFAKSTIKLQMRTSRLSLKRPSRRSSSIVVWINKWVLCA